MSGGSTAKYIVFLCDTLLYAASDVYTVFNKLYTELFVYDTFLSFEQH